MNSELAPGRMEGFLRSRRDAGSKLLVAYITGGFEGWEAAVETAAAAGADAIEIGIPFSDPVMDGPVIQEASQGRWKVALRQPLCSQLCLIWTRVSHTL